MAVVDADSVSERLVSVQILRGVAALLVAVFHVTLLYSQANGAIWGWGWVFGAVGVDLFFIISGFVMAFTMAKYERKPGEFISRRYLRIAPVYYIAAVFWTIFQFVDGGAITTPAIVSNIVILPFGADYVFPMLGVGWTLSFEFTFYALVCLTLALRRGPGFLFVLVCSLTAIGSVFKLEPALLRWFTHPILFEFALGVLAYLLASKPLPKWPAILGAAALIYQAVTPVYFDQSPAALMDGFSVPARLLFWALPWFLVFNAAIRWNPSRRWVGPAQLLGDASYSIYLTHGLIIGLTIEHVPWPASLLLAVFSGIAFYRWIESPLLRSAHKKAQLSSAQKRRPVRP